MGSRGFDLSLDLDFRIPEFGEISEPLPGKKKSVKNKDLLREIEPIKLYSDSSGSEPKSSNNSRGSELRGSSGGYNLDLDLDLRIPSLEEITEAHHNKNTGTENKGGIWGIDPVRLYNDSRGGSGLMDSGFIERHKSHSASVGARAKSTSLSSSTKIKYDFYELSGLNLLADLSVLDITSTPEGYSGKMKTREVGVRAEATAYGSLELEDAVARLESLFSRQLYDGDKNRGSVSVSAIDGEGLFEKVGGEVKMKEGILRGSGLDLSFDLPSSGSLSVRAEASADPLMLFSLVDEDIREKRGTLNAALSRTTIRVKDGQDFLEGLRSYSHSLSYSLNRGRISGVATLSDH